MSRLSRAPNLAREWPWSQHRAADLRADEGLWALRHKNLEGGAGHGLTTSRSVLAPLFSCAQCSTFCFWRRRLTRLAKTVVGLGGTGVSSLCRLGAPPFTGVGLRLLAWESGAQPFLPTYWEVLRDFVRAPRLYHRQRTGGVRGEHLLPLLLFPVVMVCGGGVLYGWVREWALRTNLRGDLRKRSSGGLSGRVSSFSVPVK